MEPTSAGGTSDKAVSVSLDELVASQGVGPVRSLEDLAAELWESDEEFDAFLDDVRRSRQADLA